VDQALAKVNAFISDPRLDNSVTANSGVAVLAVGKYEAFNFNSSLYNASRR
jgi:hypothetical protein